MKIAVFGTGTVGRTLAARLAELGHDVTLGTRDPAATTSRTGPGATGAAPFADWAAGNPGILPATFADAAAGAELVVNATRGAASLDVLALAGAGNLGGKIILDVANPLDFGHGMPPTLLVKDSDSLGEQIQRAYPAARVVKSLNTLTAGLMAYPARLPEPGTVFISGNDSDAKDTVAGLLADFGHRDVIDLGDITTARGAEMLMPIWLRLWGALGSSEFNFKIVR
ncbi:NADPH-dependent F420 reductase [Paeniglutamicibacter psychrophenolicus]|uniref:NADPH-dependent F420 reductase n=1 Tax=Paeniglutamicibacter psychrophenolicus TaxID=257454 RepID=UPI0027834AAB|nr:NAD(P)-binding domain-containing protein [Paeniglutamicibacter psychrophenolicus]MDQ0093505.1 putative dinucleotide-binding enzyme [Paeniglutamicibacter psychrophenolicus]